MKSIDIKGELRSEFGKKCAKQFRQNNLIPCVLYGVDKDEKGLPVAIPFSVTVESVRNLIYSPDIFVVNLTVGNNTVKAVLKEIQFHPVKDNILHMDFYQVTDNKPIVMEVPVKLTGLAAGVKAGGKLTQILRRVKAKAIYTDIPEFIPLDVTNLNIGKTIKVGEISYDKLELVNPKNTVVCSVMVTRTTKATNETEEQSAS